MKRQPQQVMPLGFSILSELDDADIDDIEEFDEFFSRSLPELNAPAAGSAVRAGRDPKKVWLINAAWIVLCLVILTGALLFALHMLAKPA